jgi:hypothetical protein
VTTKMAATTVNSFAALGENDENTDSSFQDAFDGAVNAVMNDSFDK